MRSSSVNCFICARTASETVESISRKQRLIIIHVKEIPVEVAALLFAREGFLVFFGEALRAEVTSFAVMVSALAVVIPVEALFIGAFFVGIAVFTAVVACFTLLLLYKFAMTFTQVFGYFGFHIVSLFIGWL